MIHIETSLEFPAGFEQLLPGLSEQAIRAAGAALRHEGAEGDLTILLAEDARLRELNRDYLGVDAPTDVLAFPAAETDPDTGAAYLGDLLISIPRAQAQAQAADHPLGAELQLLVVHGVLHLLGHDHAEPADKARMWAAQADVLKGLGLDGIAINE